MQNVPKIVRQRMAIAPPALNHPDADMLTAFAEKSLSALERDSVLEHLGGCNECRDIVALASPEIELQTVVVPVRAGWLAWPALRWGFAAAGIAAIASLGILRYQQRQAGRQETTMAAKVTVRLEPAAPQAQTQPPAVPSNPSSVGTPERVLDENGLATSDKSLKLSESKPDSSPINHSVPIAAKNALQSDAFGGATGGAVRPPATAMQLSHGPRMPDTWQQRRTPQAQVPHVESLPSAVVARNAAPAAESQLGTGQSQSDYSRAKQPVPPGPAAMNQRRQDQAADTGGSQISPGQMGGYIVDPSGAVVANARVTVTPADAGAPATTVTDSEGRWLIAGLPSGSYNVRADALGFKTTVRSLNYDANLSSMYNFQMSVGDVSETVAVASASPAVQTETGQVEGAITQKDVAQAGLNGRNFSQLVALTPNTTPSLRWNISSQGALQRSFDQGKTWQNVDVATNQAPSQGSTNQGSTSVDIVAEAAPVKKQKHATARAAGSITFRAVAANGPDVWAGGSNGALYHSLDSGDQWMPVRVQSPTAALNGDIVSLQFPDPQHGTVVTSAGETWTTADDGQSWQKQ